MSRSLLHGSRTNNILHLNYTRNILQSPAILHNHHNNPSLFYHSHYNISLKDRFVNWRKRSEEKSNVQAWLGESRRFLEYQDYNLRSFEAHCKTLVEAHDKAGPVKQFMRSIMEWMNPDKYNAQNQMIEESRTLVQIIDTFPEEAMQDPMAYFKHTNKSKLALETKMHSQDIDMVLQKFNNNERIHSQLKKRVVTGDDLPRSSEELHSDLSKPKQLNETYKKSIAFGSKNPNKKNDLFEEKIVLWNEKCWDGPYRRRKFYNKKKSWRQRDWRQYQPKWRSEDVLLTDEEENYDPIEWKNARSYGRLKYVKDKDKRKVLGPNDDSVWDDTVFKSYYSQNKRQTAQKARM